MLKVHQVKKILSEIPVSPRVGTVPLGESLSRILAQDVFSPLDMPPFDKSAMDGYAVSSTDGSDRFNIIETIAAGDVPKSIVGDGECAKIMTGAMLPRGADKVIKVELTSESDGIMTPRENEGKMNVCCRGEDVTKGQKVLSKGALIRPAEVGILASMGVSTPMVFDVPRVVILTTGSEIVEPGEGLTEGKIFNSNGYSLQAQLLGMGIHSHYGGIISDNLHNMEKTFSLHMKDTDVILVSGGVSMGDFDFVPAVLEKLGVRLQFDKVAVKPGKPTVFGEKDGNFFWGLPGNPVSTFVIFEVFVKPFLYRMMGHDYQVPYFKGIMKNEYIRKRTQRTSFIPVRYDEGSVEPVMFHGSAHFDSLSGANGLLQIPAGVDLIEKGKSVYVRPI